MKLLARRAWWVLWLGATLPGVLLAADVQVAVASNFMVPLQKIAAAFTRETGHKVVPAFGSTGKLYAQIKNGAPFQALLAADQDTPQKLVNAGLAQPHAVHTYAIGRLVLWSRDPALVDGNGDVLRQPPRGHLAVADPKLAPYGRAALQVLSRLGVLPVWRSHLVQGESISQAHQFVASGSAPLGLLALAQVMEGGSRKQGSAWVVPAHLHEPIRQDAVLLQRGQGQPAALAFMQFLRSETAQAIIRAHGYEL